MKKRITPHGAKARKAAQAALRVLSKSSRKTRRHVVRIPAIEVPKSVADALVTMLDEYANAKDTVISGINGGAELSTTEAAARLRISRPTLIDVLESGEIEYRMVGTHRRVSEAALDEYLKKQSVTPVRGAAVKGRARLGLQKMAEITDEAGAGY